MRFFITGGTGFIGKHLIRFLVQQGHHVVALVRNVKKIASLPTKQIECIRGSLESFKDPNFKIPVCDQVIHLAGTVTAKKESEYYQNNCQAVIDLVECLKKQNWQPERFVFSSSLAACGPSLPGKPLTEDGPLKPIDAYGKSKKMAEDYLLRQSLFPVSIVRPCTVIGPMDTNVFNLYKVAKYGLGFVVQGINQEISFIAVDDLVDAIYKITGQVSKEHHVYFAAHPHTTHVHALWRQVANSLDKKIHLIPLPKFLVYTTMIASTALSNMFNKPNIVDKKYYQQLTASAWTCSSQKLERELNWQAKTNLTQVFEQTAKSYLEAGWI